MRQHRYGVVSSTSDSGAPQSALVGIATTPALEVIFDTERNSRKYRNLKQRPTCSFVIGWSGEQTLQLEGIAHEPEAADLRRVQDTYLAQWPEGLKRINCPGIAYLVVHPHWIRYSDYDQSPAFIQEGETEGPQPTIFDL